MKPGLFLLSFFLLTMVQGVNAQRKTIEDRVAAAHESFQTTLKLDEAKLSQADQIFTDFYTAQQQIRENIQAPKTPSLASGFGSSFAPKQDFQSVRQKNDNIINERDSKLKKLLTPDQYKIWKDEIEPSLKKR